MCVDHVVCYVVYTCASCCLLILQIIRHMFRSSKLPFVQLRYCQCNYTNDLHDILMCLRSTFFTNEFMCTTLKERMMLSILLSRTGQ